MGYKLPPLPLVLLLVASSSSSQMDKHRPQFHFSIASNWINDPNGMVYMDGEYHLQYQHHPYSTQWGPMHWGHSVSKDLITWVDLPITLYPDPLGDIFSGSAVVDGSNSTGFQEDPAVPPMVAIFTSAGQTQQQSIAYSLDKGRSFTKYPGNPVIPNDNINLRDFRDPKVLLYKEEEGDPKWVLVLAAGNRVMFYESLDLKGWRYLSEFGVAQGAHTGVWECPDLFPITVLGETVWVLIVSINPGGPNGGSVTQYFIGSFDGTSFHSPQVEPLWMDWGVDNYAAVSFFGEPSGRVVMMGWMNNWDYAGAIPTGHWRGQMTLPREMSLRLVNGQLRLASKVVDEVRMLRKNESYEFTEDAVIEADGVLEVPTRGNRLLHANLTFDTQRLRDGGSIAICFLNSLGQEVCTGYDKGRNFPIFLNRELSGDIGFHSSFSRRITTSRELFEDKIKFEIYLDVSAIEVFVDGGLSCMTALFYPDVPYERMEIRHHAGAGSVLLVSGGSRVEGLRGMGDVAAK